MHKPFLALALISVGLLATVVHADFTSSQWQYRAPIVVTTQSGKAASVELVLNDVVYQHANNTLSDLRIMRDVTEVPYVMTKSAPRRQQEVYRARIFNKGSVPGESTTFMVDVGSNGIFHNQLHIDTTSHNFTRQVEVRGSTDATNWVVLERAARVYDFTIDNTSASRGSSVQETTVYYPETTYRYLQINIIDRGEAPLVIGGAQIRREVSVPAKRVPYATTIVEQHEDPEHQATVLAVDMLARGIPTDQMNLDIAGGNFQRSVALEGSDDQKQWSPVLFRDAIFSFDTSKFSGSKTTIDYPESHYRYFRLTIFNKDNAPLQVRSVLAQGYIRTLVFEGTPTTAYTLYYGNPKARYPEYDLEKYIDYMDSTVRHGATVGNEQLNPEFKAPPVPVVPFTERYPGLLLATLLLMVLVIAGLLVKVLKSAKH